MQQQIATIYRIWHCFRAEMRKIKRVEKKKEEKKDKEREKEKTQSCVW